MQFHLKEPQCGARHQPDLLPGEPDGAGRGRHGRHASGQLRAVQVQVVAPLRHLTELVRFENFWETDCRGQFAALSRRADRPAEEGGPRAPDGAACRRARPDRQRRLRRRAGLQEGARQDVRHLAGAAGRHGDDVLQPQERRRCPKRTIPMPTCCGRRSPTPIDHEGIHQAVFNGIGEISKGFYSSASPWHAQGHRRLAEVRPRQGQGAAQEGQGRRREAHHHRQRHLPLHAAVGRAGARHAEGCRVQCRARDPARAGDARKAEQGRLQHRLRRPTPTASIPTAGMPATSCRRRRRPGAATATRTRRPTRSSWPRARSATGPSAGRCTPTSRPW